MKEAIGDNRRNATDSKMALYKIAGPNGNIEVEYRYENRYLKADKERKL